MRILVTGGTGYVGSACARFFARKGHRVTVLDNLSNSSPHSISAISSCTLLTGNVTDPNLLDAIFGGTHFDTVIHCAALASVPDSFDNPGAYWRNNLGGTETLLTAMTTHRVRRLIFSSTAAVYAHPVRLETITESSPINPITPYGQSKLASEWIIQSCGRLGIEATVFRYFNIAGSESSQHGESRYPETHLIPVALKSALSGRRLGIHGSSYPTRDGTCVRDYVHVLDVARAHHLALSSPKSIGETFNISSGTGTSNLDIVEVCSHVSGTKIRYNFDPAKRGDPAFLVADSSKATRVINWRPTKNLMDIVSSTWIWLKRNPTGYPK